MKRLLFILLLLPYVPPLFADQPIMNMMPRWNGGWGVQGQVEYKDHPELLDGRDTLDPDLGEHVSIFHLEGVYTWTKEIRMTLKVPYVLEAEREVMIDGRRVTQTDEGIGDAKLALPLKRYFNIDGASGSWSFVPQVQIPLGEEDDDYEFYRGHWGNGLGLGWERETPLTFLSTGLSAWTFYGNRPNEFRASLDLGLNFLDRGQALIETDFHAESDGSRILSLGPALYWRWSDIVHTRLEWKPKVYDDQGDDAPDHSGGSDTKIGIGFVF